MKPNIDAILLAMKADMIPARTSGRWTVEKVIVNPGMAERSRTMREGNEQHYIRYTPPGTYTHLWCDCETKVPTMMGGKGDLVMQDFPHELRTHLEFILRASGRVLVGGLGLGCVVRGLLAAGRVESIDLIERSRDVINLCGASVNDPRVRIHKMDMLIGDIDGGPWDWAWWDFWSDPDKDEPHLSVTHMKCMARYVKRVKNLQGAWSLPRKFKRRVPTRIL